MNDQPSLFDSYEAPMVRAMDRPTSVAAAQRVNVAGDRRRALVALVTYGPATDYELAERTDRQQNSIGKRRKELVDIGYVEPVHVGPTTLLTRPAPSGASAIVWQATPEGVEFYRSLGS